MGGVPFIKPPTFCTRTVKLASCHGDTLGNSKMGICYSQALQPSQENTDTAGEEYEEFEDIRPVVVTGFGKLNPEDSKESDKSNFSWRVVDKLSENIIDYQGRTVPVIKGKQQEGSPEAVKACYSYIEDQSFKDWLDSTDALVYLHLGVNIDSLLGNHIYLVTTGRRDVNFSPDKCDVDDTPRPGHLYPKLEIELDGENSLQLVTSFQTSQLHEKLRDKFKSGVAVKTSSTKSISLSFESTDNAGRYLCDFLYYVSLNLATKRNRNPNFPRNVLLIHLPKVICLPEDTEFNCTERSEMCASEKAEALAKVIEFILKELLAQIYAANSHTAPVE